ncbi:MAG TPA: DUF892 family protein [Ktedonobacteraceae bacterium]|jgi:ferritin-like metal-binding protein YciE|nr:DUF892 family protein [Ktedonobacteraceae bacterium]
MAIRDPQELFLHKLAEMYDVEQKLVKVLPILAKEVDNQEAKTALTEHEQETRQHARNLEQCFQMLGDQPKIVDCQTVKGLIQDHEMFVQQQPAPAMLTKYDLCSARESEAIETAKYAGLIDDANNLGLVQVVPLLEENKLQEEAADKKLAKIGHELGKRIAEGTKSR